MANRKQAKPQTVHGFVENLLARTKKPYAEIAKEAREAFKSETSPASVRHYASKMRRDGRTVKDRPTVREAAFA